jgi:broad specificity phosphatase PhoE
VRILLVRHGQTDYNASLRVQGQIDIPLNETGRWQAERIGMRLSTYSPGLILTSDLSRAADTAKSIARHHPNTPFEQTELLREVRYGVFEGLSREDITARYPEEFHLWQGNDDGYMPPEAETIDEQRARGNSVAKLLIDRGGEHDTTIVVSHGAIMRSIMASFLELSVAQQIRMHYDNTSLSVIELTSRGMMLRLSNDTSHLGERSHFP